MSLATRIGVIDEGALVALGAPLDIAVSKEPYVRRLLDALPAVPRGTE